MKQSTSYLGSESEKPVLYEGQPHLFSAIKAIWKLADPSFSSVSFSQLVV